MLAGELRTRLRLLLQGLFAAAAVVVESAPQVNRIGTRNVMHAAAVRVEGERREQLVQSIKRQSAFVLYSNAFF